MGKTQNKNWNANALLQPFAQIPLHIFCVVSEELEEKTAALFPFAAAPARVQQKAFITQALPKLSLMATNTQQKSIRA